MELKTSFTTLNSAQGLWNGNMEIPMEAELLIPDYQPQIFKIVKGIVKPVILQKQVHSSRLQVEGYLRCIVFYQDEENKGLCKAEQKLPFSRTQELPESEYADEQIQVWGEVEYLNCRATNSRRIEIRGAYDLQLTAQSWQPCTIVSQLSGGGVEQDPFSVPTLHTVASREKMITLEDTVALEQAPDIVLDIDGFCRMEDVKMVTGKVIMKGVMNVQISYRTQGDPAVQCQETEIGFTQLFDVDDLSEDCLCSGYARLTGSSLTADAPEQLGLSATALIHLNVYRPEEAPVIRDAFSTQFETQTEKQELCTEAMEQELKARVPCQCSVTLPPESARIVACFGEVQPPRVETVEGARVLRGALFVHLIVCDALEEIECYDRTAEYHVPCKALAGDGDYRAECSAQLIDLTAQKTAADFSVSAEIAVDGLLLRVVHAQALAKVECGQPLICEPDEPTLRIYYARAGERLFEVAKRFHASPGLLTACNHLEEGVFSTDRRLLVPGRA